MTHTPSEDLHLQKVHPRFFGPQGILHCNSALVFPESQDRWRFRLQCSGGCPSVLKMNPGAPMVIICYFSAQHSPSFPLESCSEHALRNHSSLALHSRGSRNRHLMGRSGLTHQNVLSPVSESQVHKPPQKQTSSEQVTNSARKYYSLTAYCISLLLLL